MAGGIAHASRRRDLGVAQVSLGVICWALGIGVLVAVLVLSGRQFAVVAPTLSIVAIFFMFSALLSMRVKSGIFGEVGFIFLGFVLAYTVIPAVNFLAVDFVFPDDFDSLNFAAISPQPEAIAVHMWRHCLFALAVAVSYLVARGGDEARASRIAVSPVDGRLVFFVVLVVAACIAVISVLSAPLIDYYSHYTRFDDLGWFEKRIAYVALLLKSGGYYFALVLMFSNARRYRWVLPVFIVAICSYEMAYSLGSRIETLSLLLASLCLFHFNVRKIGVRDGAIALMALLVMFTGVEFYRGAEFDLQEAVRNFSERGLKIAMEFGAVFYTSFHLYYERAQGTLPPHEWPMLVNDFMNVVPFVDHVAFNSQYWYAQAYFPDAIVPPQTMGPIADSAIWGGGWDLVIRGVITGAIYGAVARAVLSSTGRLLSVTCYVFLFATCVMALKYSVVYQMAQMVKLLVPIALAVFVFQKTIWRRGVWRGAGVGVRG